MKAVILRRSGLACALALVSCSTGMTSNPNPPSPDVARAHISPATCKPTVWASSATSNAVYGYISASSTPCVTLTGPYNGVFLNSPIGLALSKSPQWLYVADLLNDRIVVFNHKGVFVKAWTTNLNGATYQPWGVCITIHGGIVGVGNRQFNNTGAAGNVEFFKVTTPNGGGPTGYATGILQSDRYCAFDRKGNFFVDGLAFGSVGGGPQIAYVAKAYVNIAAQTLTNSTLGNANSWSGMYSRINSVNTDTLSVGAAVPYATTQTVYNWKVTGPAAGPLTFTALSPYSLTSFPSTGNPLYQLAPSAVGSVGNLYISDYGAGTVFYTPANGGPVAPYNPVSATAGVITQPIGQY